MKTATVLIFLLGSTISRAQIKIDTAYTVEVISTASPVISFFGRARIPTMANKPALGYGFFLRGMWRPGRLLSVGVLTGYAHIASDDFTVGTSAPRTYHAELLAIPIQMALSMQTGGLEIGVGIGPYMMISNIVGGISPPASGNRLEIAMTYFGSYYFSLGDSFRVGPELRLTNLSYRRIFSVMPSFNVRYTPVRY